MAITGYFVTILEGISHHLSSMPEIESILFGMASIILISAIFAFVARLLRQPLIPAYVLTGLIAGPVVLGLITSQTLIFAFLEIGIVFLLFTAGLEVSFKKIKEINLVKITLIGVLQVVLIFLLVYFSRDFFNMSAIQSVYLGIILAFSSTMVDLKLLSDKGELVTLHGRLVLGILLLQDLVAIVAIALLTTDQFSVAPLVFTFVKLFLILVVAFVFQKFILDRLFKYAARSTELLFISSLGILFLFIILSYLSEVSIAIGAFIAGVSLANSPFKTELESRISPVKDFFSILFFVSLGMQIVFIGLSEHIYLLIFLVVGALILKPIVLFVLLRAGTFTHRTSFQTATILGQLSEFSLIIGVLGLSKGIFTESVFSTVVLGTVITMSLTPYLIEKKETLFKVFRKPTSLLKFLPERAESEHEHNGHKTILLIGAHRIGSTLIKELDKERKKMVVIDYNPEITKKLSEKKIANIYGDVMSPEIFEKVDTSKLKLVVSTLPGYEENLRILKKFKKENFKTRVILTAQRISEAEELYKKGADYVIMPKVIAGQELTKLIKEDSKTKLKHAKSKHLEYLNDIHNILY